MLKFTGELIPKAPVWDRPFYWTAVNDPRSAASGWYQWTPQGLKYLGASILEDDSNGGISEQTVRGEVTRQPGSAEQNNETQNRK